MAEFITEEGKEALGKFAKYDEVLRELAKLLVPHLVDQMTAEIGKRIKSDLTEMDDERICEIVRSELMSYDFIDEDKAREIADEQIAEMDFDTYQFADAVKDAVRNFDLVVSIEHATVEIQ
jgi:hypothetical protein